jgi:hypothetical protein
MRIRDGCRRVGEAETVGVRSERSIDVRGRIDNGGRMGGTMVSSCWGSSRGASANVESNAKLEDGRDVWWDERRDRGLDDILGEGSVPAVVNVRVER